MGRRQPHRLVVEHVHRGPVDQRRRHGAEPRIEAEQRGSRASAGAGQRIGEMRGENPRCLLEPRARDRDRDAVEEQLACRRQQPCIERGAAARDDALAHARRQVGWRLHHAAPNSASTYGRMPP